MADVLSEVLDGATSFTAEHPDIVSCIFDLFQDCGDDSGQGGGATTTEVNNPPVTVTQAPPLTTVPPASPPPQEINSPPQTRPEPGGKPSPVAVPTPGGNIPTATATAAVRGSTNFASPTPNSSSPASSSSFISNQQPTTITNPPASLNSTQNPTSALTSSSTAVESTAATSTLSHRKVDPRIIVPVVLVVVALAAGGAIIWLKRIRDRRRESARLEERPTPIPLGTSPTDTAVPEKVRLNRINNSPRASIPTPVTTRSTEDIEATTPSHQEPQIGHQIRMLMGRFDALEAAIRNPGSGSDTSSRTHSDESGYGDRPPEYASQLAPWNNSRTQLIERRNEALEGG